MNQQISILDQEGQYDSLKKDKIVNISIKTTQGARASQKSASRPSSALKQQNPDTSVSKLNDSKISKMNLLTVSSQSNQSVPYYKKEHAPLKPKTRERSAQGATAAKSASHQRQLSVKRATSVRKSSENSL